MDIHRFEKIWLGVSVVLILGLISTVVYGAVGPGVQMVERDGGQIQPDAVDEHPEFSEPGVRKVGEDEYHVYVVARQFLFEPGTTEPIRVPAGSTVTFFVTTPDVTHGFELVGTNVNVMVIPGQIAQITVQFDEPAEYGIVCNEYCGAAHHEMAGTLEVVPEEEYDESEYLVADETGGDE